jgi:hypothetical protein
MIELQRPLHRQQDDNFGRCQLQSFVGRRAVYRPGSHEPPALECPDVSSGQFKPFAILPSVGEATVPIPFYPRGIICPDFVNRLGWFRELNG